MRRSRPSTPDYVKTPCQNRPCRPCKCEPGSISWHIGPGSIQTSLVEQPLTDEQIAALARRQHGAVSRAQLLELGLGADAITYRCQTGRLYRAHLGVFTVG